MNDAVLDEMTRLARDPEWLAEAVRETGLTVGHIKTLLDGYHRRLASAMATPPGHA
jgi:hypothetical protein